MFRRSFDHKGRYEAAALPIARGGENRVTQFHQLAPRRVGTPLPTLISILMFHVVLLYKQGILTGERAPRRVIDQGLFNLLGDGTG